VKKQKSLSSLVQGLDSQQKDELLKNIGESAHVFERDYRGCSRCVLHALQIHLGLSDGEVLKAATALGGGVARTGETCGALIGGMMAIGLAFALPEMDDSRASPPYMETVKRSMELTDRFKKEFGGTRCYQVQESLLGRHFNLRDTEDVAEFRKSGHQICEDKVVRQAAMLAAEVILEPESKQD